MEKAVHGYRKEAVRVERVEMKGVSNEGCNRNGNAEVTLSLQEAA